MNKFIALLLLVPGLANAAPLIGTNDIKTGSVTNALLATMNNSTVKCNVSGAGASPTDCTAGQAAAFVGSATLLSTFAGQANLPGIVVNGAPYTAGTATTNKPQVQLEGVGATSNAWNANGTWLGINAASGFTGRLFDAQINGNTAFSIDYGAGGNSSNPGVFLRNINDNSNGGLNICGSSGAVGASQNCISLYSASVHKFQFYSLAATQGATVMAGWDTALGNMVIGGGTFGETTQELLVMNNNFAAYNGYITQVNRALSAQTADLHQWQNSAKAVLARIDVNGNASVQKLSVGSTVGAGATLVDVNGTGVYTGSTIAAPPCAAISASNVDWSLGNCFTKSLSANTTLTFSNRVAGQTIMIRVTNPASYTLTFPNTAGAGTSVLWAGSTIPILSTAGHTDIFTVFFDGTNMYGNPTQNY